MPTPTKPEVLTRYGLRDSDASWFVGKSGLLVRDGNQCEGARGYERVDFTDATTPALWERHGEANGWDYYRYRAPYTNRQITLRWESGGKAAGRIALKASGLQRDHVVALRDAYDSGACWWTEARWTSFGRDIDNLLLVSESENIRKSDDGPAEWTPPNARFVCAYLAIYVTTKRAYGLTITSADERAVVNSGCLAEVGS